MKKLTIYILAVAFLLAVFASSVISSPRGRIDREKREEVYEKIRMLRMLRMAEYMDLDTETALRLSEELKKYDDRQKELMKEGRELLSNLKDAVEKNAPESEISPIIAKIKVNMDKQHSLRKEKLESVKNVLNVQQQAKFILFEVQFKKRMTELARKAFGRKRSGAREPRPEGF